MMSFVVALACLVPALLLGGLLSGLDRRLTARLQSRMGPPLLQPF
jgi:ech hydrogenase subunit B